MSAYHCRSRIGQIRMRTLLSGLVNPDGRPSRAGALAILGSCGALTLSVVAGAWIDGALALPGNGKGLVQHYAIWVFFITNPLILLLACDCRRRFLELTSNLDKFAIEATVPRSIRSLVRKHRSSLDLAIRTRAVLALMMTIGLLGWVTNVIQTTDPIGTYGNDVLDSIAHPCGFVATKAFLAVTWIWIYPIALFIVIHVTVSQYVILQRLHGAKALRVDPFDGDGCGGLSAFGRLNLQVMLVHAALFAVMMSLVLTHEKATYVTVDIPLVALSLFFVAQSAIAVAPTQAAVASYKRRIGAAAGVFLTPHLEGPKSLGDFPDNVLLANQHVQGLSPYPYRGPVRMAVNVLRLVPSLVAAARLISIM